MTVKLDLSDLEDLTDALERFAKRGIPFAVRNSLNTSAFEGRKLWVRQIEADFTTRNRFTTRSLRVERARGSVAEDMESVLGSTAGYMLTQEEGGTVRGKRGALPIPTSTAAGQAKGTRPRTKVVRRANWMSAIKLKPGRNRASSRRQRNAIAMRIAVKSGQKFFLLERSRGKGIARVTGRKKLNVRLIWDLSRRSARVGPTPTLARTLRKLDPQLADIHRKSLIQQLRFHKVID